MWWKNVVSPRLQYFYSIKLIFHYFTLKAVQSHDVYSTKVGKSGTPSSSSLSVAGSFMNNENCIHLVKTNTCVNGKGILNWSDIDKQKVFFQEHLVHWHSLSNHHQINNHHNYRVIFTLRKSLKMFLTSILSKRQRFFVVLKSLTWTNP